MRPVDKMVRRINSELVDPEIEIRGAGLAWDSMDEYTEVLNHPDLLPEKRQILKNGAFSAIYGGKDPWLADRIK